MRSIRYVALFVEEKDKKRDIALNKFLGANIYLGDMNINHVVTQSHDTAAGFNTDTIARKFCAGPSHNVSSWAHANRLLSGGLEKNHWDVNAFKM